MDQTHSAHAPIGGPLIRIHPSRYATISLGYIRPRQREDDTAGVVPEKNIKSIVLFSQNGL